MEGSGDGLAIGKSSIPKKTYAGQHKNIRPIEIRKPNIEIRNKVEFTKFKGPKPRMILFVQFYFEH